MRKLLLFLLLAAPLGAQTRYVDFVGGSDQWDGTAKTHGAGSVGPWKSSPYMQGNGTCSDNAGTHFGYSHSAGQQIIFKGGVTWPNACFTLTHQAGGTSLLQDYYGVDMTWFTGGSWTRPIFDLQSIIVTDDYRHSVILLRNIGFITWDNIEIKNQQGGDNDGGDPTMNSAFNFFGQTGNVIVKNVYIHAYTKNQTNLTAAAQGAEGGVYGASLMDHVTCYDGDGGLIGQPVGSVPLIGCSWNTTEVRNSTLDTYAQGVLGGVLVHDNELKNGSSAEQSHSTSHTNDIEDTGQVGMRVYNNFIHDSNVGQHVAVFPGGAVYNNVMYNVSAGAAYVMVDNGISSAQNTPSATTVFYNNTLACASINCVYINQRGGTTSIGTVLIQNNIWVTPGSTIIFDPSGAPFTASNNYPMPSGEATTFGYTVANKFAPTSSDANTVAQGLNLTSSCTGNLTALCNDTRSSPWFGSSAVARPNSAWDLGAFQGGSAAVAPPTVAITAPTANSTVSGSSVTLTMTCSANGGRTITSVQFQIDGANYGAAGNASPFTDATPFDSTKASNANHTVTAICTDSASVQSSVSETVTVSNSIPGCFVSDFPWIGNISFPAITGSSATVTWTAVPNSTGQDDVMGLSNGVAAQYSDLATSIHFNSSGNIDAYDASISGYHAVNTAPYTPGTTYTFSATLNFTNHTYSASETSPSNIVIATNYLFRATQNTITQVTTLNGETSIVTPNTEKVCSVATTPVMAIAPSPANFGNVTQGVTSTPVTVTVSNTGGATLTLATPFLGPNTGANPADFANAGGGTCSNGLAILAGSSCTILEALTPSTTSAESATLNVNGTVNGSIAMNGTGLPVPTQPAPSIGAIIMGFNTIDLEIANCPKTCKIHLACMNCAEPKYVGTVQ